MRIAILLTACGGPEPDLPTPYIYDEEAPPAPTVTAADLEVGIADAVAAAMSIDADPVFAAYDAAMAGRTDVCPATYDDGYGGRYWYDACTTDGGAMFEGYGYDYAGEYYDGTYLATVAYRSSYLAATVTDASGRVFGGAGSVAWTRSDGDAGDHYRDRYVQGSFAWDGPEDDGTWVEAGLSPDLYVARYWIDGVDGSYVGLDGGLAPLGGAFVAASFDGVVAMSPAFSECDEPAGTIALRDAEGNWFDVLFDGDENGYAVDPSRCDGCGTAYFRGDPIGAVCVDVVSLAGDP